MKRWKIMAFAGLVLVVCIGLSIRFFGMEKLNLPFTETEIKMVTMHHFTVPTEAEEKTVKDPETIARIYKTIAELSIRNEARTSITGGETLEFQIFCADGTQFTLCTTQVQDGTQLTLPDDAVYTTHDAVLPLWYENDIAAVPVT